MTRGLLFVVSAPSGTGKTTLVERLAETLTNLVISRSYTSRTPRPGEQEGVDYNFISREVFEQMIARGAFLEHADVFGNLYGTGAQDTDRHLQAGHDVVVVIDVQGARIIRNSGLEQVSVFVLPPSFDVLSERLRRRSQDSEAQICHRLEVARQEVTAVVEYDYVVVNDELESSVNRLRAIVVAERARRRVMQPTADAIIRTFHRPADPATKPGVARSDD